MTPEQPFPENLQNFSMKQNDWEVFVSSEGEPSFLGFIEKHKETLTKLSDTYRAMYLLQQTLIDSEEITALSREGVPHVIENARDMGRGNIVKSTTQIEQMIHGKILETIFQKKGVLPDPKEPAITPSQVAKKEWNKKIAMLSFAYEEQIAPLESSLSQVEESVLPSFYEFVTQNPMRLKEISEYLEAEDTQDNEILKPFFIRLSRRVQYEKQDDRSLETIEAEASVVLHEILPEELIIDFVSDKINKEQENLVSHGGYSLSEHITFSRLRDKKRNPDVVFPPLKSMTAYEIVEAELPDVTDWPLELREELSKHIYRFISGNMDRIRRSLRSYQIPDPADPYLKHDVSHYASIGKKRPVHDRAEPTRGREEESDKSESDTVRFSIGMLSSTVDGTTTQETKILDLEEQEKLLQEYARNFSPHIQVQKDFLSAVDYLLNDPYPRPNRRGIKKLVDATQRIGGKQGIDLELYSFDPIHASGLKLSKHFPKAARIVFFIDHREADNPRIVLQVFTDHNAYHRFVSNKTRRPRRK